MVFIVWRARITSRKPGANRSTWASIFAVMSMVEPCGTWQYAHAVCRPAGARDGSKRLGWASSTNGRPACSPANAARSDRDTSSSVPPTWTVAVDRHSAAAHGIGAESAQSILKIPGPYR